MQRLRNTKRFVQKFVHDDAFHFDLLRFLILHYSVSFCLGSGGLRGVLSSDMHLSAKTKTGRGSCRQLIRLDFDVCERAEVL
jgi:hypothetical protein